MTNFRFSPTHIASSPEIEDKINPGLSPPLSEVQWLTLVPALDDLASSQGEGQRVPTVVAAVELRAVRVESARVVHGQLVPLPALHLAVLHSLLHSDLQLGHLRLLCRGDKTGGEGQQKVKSSEQLHLQSRSRDCDTGSSSVQ